MTKHNVFIQHCPDLRGKPSQYPEEDIEVLVHKLHEIIDTFPAFEQKIRQAHVLLKPNLVRPNVKRLPGMTTDPRIIFALIRVCFDYQAKKVSVGEKPGYGYPAREAFRAAGLQEHINKYNADLVCFDEEQWVIKDNPHADVFKKQLFPKPALDCDVLINIPKMKTHMHTVVSLGLKNFQGLVADDERMLYHRCDISHKIVDTVLHRSPDFTVVDGLWPMEGQAPFFGQAIENFNVVVAGDNVTAVDTITCSVMGIDPDEVTHIRLAAEKNLGPRVVSEITVQGHELTSVQRPFKRAVISSVGVYPQVKVIEGGACNGCLSAIRHSLDKLNFDGNLKRLDTFSVFVGRSMPNTACVGDWLGDLWLFGNCAVELIFPELTKRKQPHFLQGCPPHVLDLQSAIKEKYVRKARVEV